MISRGELFYQQQQQQMRHAEMIAQEQMRLAEIAAQEEEENAFLLLLAEPGATASTAWRRDSGVDGITRTRPDAG